MHAAVSLFLLLSVFAAATPGASGTSSGGEPATEAAPEPIAGGPTAPPMPPELAAPRPRRYGDRGTPEIAIGLGYSSLTGFLAAGGFRYFVLDGVAPGVEGTYVSGGAGQSAYGLALLSLRVVPLRTTSFALVLTGRGGRVLLADHADGWGVGGAAGVILLLSRNVGLELGYEFLRLLPANFCADLTHCTLQGPVLGFRLSF